MTDFSPQDLFQGQFPCHEWRLGDWALSSVVKRMIERIDGRR